jgi:hypothetical protein
MAIIKKEHWYFYLLGRGEKRLPKIDLDEAALAKAIVDEAPLDKFYENHSPLRHLIFDACKKALTPLAVGRRRTQWLAEHAAEIAEADGDGDAAYNAWLAGITDELVYSLEESVLGELSAMVYEVADDGTPSARAAEPVETPDDGEDDEEDDDDDDEDEDDDDEEEDDEPPVVVERRSPIRRR